ncbi:unnamed protein product [Dibothriocephalus latus]|uniref:Uncharacterized protein n=1 Tax=Dibothriocephalus latus TaxID=60516 RepID=A0A3P7P5J5_DIBLA|nr:unnamed protein product [Dibothriocephalus latus]
MTPWHFPPKQNSSEPVPFFFVGNKSDLARLREVPMTDVQKPSEDEYKLQLHDISAEGKDKKKGKMKLWEKLRCC